MEVSVLQNGLLGYNLAYIGPLLLIFLPNMCIPAIITVIAKNFALVKYFGEYGGFSATKLPFGL